MGFLRETGRILWGYRKTLILLLVPTLSAPLLAMHNGPAKGGWVVIVMAAYWITEALPLAVTALLPMILFPLLGILDTDDVTRNYFKDTVVLFFGSMVMAVSIEERNVHKRIALGTLLVMGSQPRWLMLGFMISTAFLSMWISNTATTAMMVPIAHAIVIQIIKERKELNARRMLKESEVVANGSTAEHDEKTGEITKEVYENPAYEDEEEATKVDVIEENAANNASNELDLESLTPSERALSKGLLLCIAYSATIGGTTTLTGTGTTVAMKGIIEEIYGDGPGITFANWFYFMVPATVISLFICWVWLQSFFLDRSCFRWFRGCSCCQAKTEEGQAAHELIQREYKALGNVSFAEMTVFVHFAALIILWLFLEPSFIPNFNGWTHLFSVPEFINDATAAMIIATSLFIFPSRMPWIFRRMFNKTEPEEDPGPMEPIMTWKSAQRRIPWNIVLLLGGGFALANGCEASGLSQWLADKFAALSGIPSWAIVVILTLVLCIFTEFTSNVATTTIFLPICASLAESLCVNPLYLMIPVTLACTYAYMLPAATPPNAIVFSFGTVSIPDMVKAGLLLNLVGIIMANVVINSMGVVVYDVLTYPSWAPDDSCVAATT
ncbi:Solute carrier family 13 member 2 [Holothuria leucospilota]|uniref:Solute carrier family 13 member 2 n=1 Tax=Holothuria leucospilota TaxID=206669 RepID=A0A9Q1CBW8_HOLLE|nr:Solute carrier family 13 member 2 [Holothuria leucospilota]